MEKLIPSSWFIPLGQLTLLLICVGALAVLIKGADLLVTGVAGVAYRLKFSKAVVAATVLSLGTTSPETAVSVTAAAAGNGSLALGNAVGSVVCNLCLIFGVGTLLTSLPADRFVLMRQGGWMLGAAVFTCGMSAVAYFLSPSEPALRRRAAVLFLGALLVYLWLSVKWGKRHPANEPHAAESAEIKQETRPQAWPVLATLCVAGLLVVLLSSRVFVASIIVLSETHWHIPKIIVAATIVSVGTSLPEFVVSLTSIYKGHGEVLIGNVIGANIMNLLFVIGASVWAAPLPLLADGSARPRIFLWLHLPVMLLTIVLFMLAARRAAVSGRFARFAGWPLLVIYVAYLTAQLLVG